jgi:hypothetical protein
MRGNPSRANQLQSRNLHSRLNFGQPSVEKFPAKFEHFCGFS